VKKYSILRGFYLCCRSESISFEMANTLKAIEGLNLTVEICNSWIWVFDANASHETPLRAANFQWSSQRGCWYLCPKSGKSQNNKPRSDYQLWEMPKIRTWYGS